MIELAIPEYGDKQNRNAKRMKYAQAAHTARAGGNQGLKRLTQERTGCFDGPVLQIVCGKTGSAKLREVTEVTTRDDQFGAGHSCARVKLMALLSSWQ